MCITAPAKRFLASHGGSAETAVAALLRDNLRYRDKLRQARDSNAPYKPDEQLTSENAELRTENERLSALVPPTGAVVLTGDDATSWPKFKALNLAPDKVTEAITQRDTLQKQLVERDRSDVVGRAAEELGFKPKILQKVAAAEGLHIEYKDVAEKGDDGKTVTKSVAHVRPAKDEKATLEPLSAYADRELADYLPALRADEGGTEDSNAAATGTAGAKGGVPYPEQRGGSKDVRNTPSHEKLVEAARMSGEYNTL